MAEEDDRLWIVMELVDAPSLERVARDDGPLGVAETARIGHYTSPDGKQEIVGNATLARGDLMVQWEKTEVDTSKGLGYRRIRLEETTFRGAPAVVWEYEVTARGLPWHVRLLGCNTAGKSYQIRTWYEPDIEDRALPVYQGVRDSFTPL